MRSKWYELKQRALAARKRGTSIRDVELSLGIPRSTLSGWFREIELTNQQRQLLVRRWRESLVLARRKAAVWHNQQKAARILLAEKEAALSLSRLNMADGNLLDIALAMIYLGEGQKTVPTTAIGNSNPLILQFFLAVLRKNYRVPLSSIRCELHLRYDQNPQRLKRYWSKILKVPLKNFTSISIDKRTKNSLTYSSYHGVCVVRCGNAAIQRKLLFLSKMFCERVITEYMGV